MKRSVHLLILFASALSACGSLPGQFFQPAATATAPVPLNTATAESVEPLFPATEPAPTDTPAPTKTITPTFGPTATETFLPTLELPPLETFEPALEIWDGLPTFLGDSRPGYYFRVSFDPRVWGLTEDVYGAPALGHRTIEYCILAPARARGLSPSVQVEHDFRKIGEIFFEVNTALLNGERQFVNYQAGDGVIFTGFQVNFTQGIDACLADTELVLATLISVRQSQATPLP